MENYQLGRRSSVIPTPSILSRPKLSMGSMMGESIAEHPRDDSSLQGPGQLNLKVHQEQRRNSISSLLGPFTRSRTGTTSGRPGSGGGVQGQGSKYPRSLKIYQYLAGNSSADTCSTTGTVDLSTLDDTFQKVNSQLVSIIAGKPPSI